MRQPRNHSLPFSSTFFTLDGGIAPIPVISVQPKDEIVEPGRGIELRAVVVTPVFATTQWYEGTAGDTRKPIAGSSFYPVTETNYWLRATNAYGSADSRTATVSPRFTSPLPVFLEQPVWRESYGGPPAASVIGPGPLSYQWLKDGLPVAGATRATLNYDPRNTPGTSGTYQLVVANAQGAVRSEPLHIIVDEPPRLLAQSQSRTVREGDRVVLDVSATGGELRYQWLETNFSVSGAYGSTFTIDSAAPGHTGTYRVSVSNTRGSVTTAPMTLTVIDHEPPRIVRPAADLIHAEVSVPFGISLEFEGRATISGVEGPLPPGLSLSSERSVTGTPTQAGTYAIKFVAGNLAGSISRTVTLQVLPQPYAPIIVVQPRSQQVYADQRVMLSAEFAASQGGFNQLYLQWKKDGVAMPFRTERELNFSAIRQGDAGIYTLEIRNNQGTTVSQPAVLSVLAAVPPPAIASQPRSVRVPPGVTVVFSVAATSAAPLSYQWSRNGAPVAGATASSLTIPAVEAPQGGAYVVEISHATGSTRSAVATLEVDEVVPGHLTNLSVRSLTAGGERTLIAGFAVSGARAKPMLLRVVGQALGRFGLKEGLPDPKMVLMSGARKLEANDNWSSASDARIIPAVAGRLGAFALDRSSTDSAMTLPLDAGSYSLPATSASPLSGLVLIELYDADETFGRVSARLANVSARSQVGTGDDVLIAGFVVAGQTSCRLLVRGIGPGLAAFGVGGALARPRLQIFNGATVITENSGWNAQAVENATAAQSVGAFALNPANADAALVTALNPGTYTVILTGLGGTTGIGLIELYALP